MKSKKAKIASVLFISVIMILIAASLIYFNFNTVGYRLSVKFHGFEQAADNVWFDKDYTGDKQEALDIIDEAHSRVSDYFGVTKSSPVIIITDNQKKIIRLGGDHDTMIVMLGGVKCYTSISSKWLTTDIIAHELTHAETHERTDSGKFLSRSELPVWFDEGLALQNDYRERYDYLSHIDEFPEEMISSTDLNKLAKSEYFYASDDTQRYYNYLDSKEEVKKILSDYDSQSICELLEKIKNGDRPDEIFSPSNP
ncbi:MAG: hypothetical protein Q4F95_02980 [Oscillospiraceae bacterium]|nr:hypothetical protein [Oscillospiraceae bacterium]